MHAQQGAVAAARSPTLIRAQARRQRNGSGPGLPLRSLYQPPAAAQPGDKLLPLLRTPGDLLALGPRVALGALNTLPALLEKR